MTETTLTILRPGQPDETVVTDLAEEPSYIELKELVVPFLNGGGLEHVTILGEDGQRTDMFVDEIGYLTGLPRNDRATEHYRRATLRREPQTNPGSLPYIAGPAILFSRRVWW